MIHVTQVAGVCACSHTHTSFITCTQFNSRNRTYSEGEAEICAKLLVLSLNQTTFIFKGFENIEKVERKNKRSGENVLAK